MARLRLLPPLAVIAALLVAAGSATGAPYTKAEPLDGPASTFGQVLDVNAADMVVGEQNLGPGVNDYSGFSWTPAGGGVPLGSPAGLGPFIPRAVNDDGAMAGSATLPNTTPHAVRMDTDGTMTDLTPANPGQSDGFDINASGVVVGWARHSPVTMRGMVWQPDGSSTELGTFSSSTNAESLARYVNDAGQVAGYAYSAFENDDGDPILHAFFWTAAGGMIDANTALGINNKKDTDVLGLTNDGKVLVIVSGSAPVLWTPGVGSATVNPPSGAFPAQPRYVGNDGTVVGTYFTSGQAHAFVWTPADGAQEIPVPGAISATGWSVNASGEVAGTMSTDGQAGHVYAWTWTEAGGLHIFPHPDGTQDVQVQVGDSGLVVVDRMDINTGEQHAFALLVADDSTAPTVASANDGATYALGEDASADYACSDEPGGSGIATCDGDVADGAALDTSSAGSRSYDVTAVDVAGNTTTATITYQVQDGDSASGTVSPGGSLSTDHGAAGPDAGDPLVTTVTTPQGGAVTIAEGGSASPPAGFDVAGQPVQITAPSATVADPLVISFSVHRSALPTGADETTLQVFRDGTEAAACTGAGATPDPCVADRSRTPAGDGWEYVTLTVRTSHASGWLTVQHQPFAFSGFKPKATRLLTMAAGLAAPITFSLDGDQGLAVLAAGTPTVEAVTCPGLKPAAVKNARTVKRSKFSYKPVPAVYKYLWKSPSTPGCVDVTIRLIDGSAHTLHFQLT